MSYDLSIIEHYSQDLKNKVEQMLVNDELTLYLANRYQGTHSITTDKALFKYTQEMKKHFMKKAPPLHKVVYDDKIDRVYNALGLNKSSSAHREIRISSLFKTAPLEFLDMIVIHELAHLKELDHNKRFYNLCKHMDSDYMQLEFDLRLYLINKAIKKAV